MRSAIAALVLVAAACASAPAADAPLTFDTLRALRWISPSADAAKVLATLPVECAPGAGPVDAPGNLDSPEEMRALGKMAFESPALLGGAAARMGLSCSSCHLNGRGNADFFVEGVSDKPGTADVTSSIFSKTRGDGSFNPKPIPDLAARDGHQIKDRKSPEFRAKVRGLIVDEFDGQEPPPYVFEAVLAYLDGLDLSHCSDPAGRVANSVRLDFGTALGAGTLPMMDTPADVSLFYLRVARERLERVYERFNTPGLEADRDMLLAMSRSLEEQADAIRAGKSHGGISLADAARMLPEWHALLGRVDADASRSLYDPGVLRAALAK